MVASDRDPMEDGPWWSDGWFVSPLNYAPEIREKFELPPRLVLHDATLRDGEQTPGVVLRREQKVQIAKLLDEIGVDRIEAGMPAVSDEDYGAISDIAASEHRAKIFAFARAMPADIDLCVKSGAKGVVIEAPSGYLRLKYQYKWTEADAIKRSLDAVAYAKSQGLEVVYFPFDGARASMPFYDELVSRVWHEAHPDSICVVDTVGCTLPQALAGFVRRVRAITNGPVEVHTHNDLGMAVAGSLAAVEAGAGVVHVSVNGLGERTGNAPLEEVAVAARILLGLENNLDLTRMKELSLLVEELSLVRLPKNKPIVGEFAFGREVGLGIEMVFQQPRTVFPYLPETVGMKPTIVLGKKSGVRSIAMKLQDWGLEATEDEMRVMLADVKQLAISERRPVSDDELRVIYANVAKELGVIQ